MFVMVNLRNGEADNHIATIVAAPDWADPDDDFTWVVLPGDTQPFPIRDRFVRGF